MSLESDLRRLAEDLRPESNAQKRVKNALFSQISAPHALQELRQSLEPSPQAKLRVWQRISATLESPAAALLDNIRELLTPSLEQGLSLWRRILPRLSPVVASPWGLQPIKWVAAFMLIALAVRISPMLFLATPTVADSAVTFIATRGEASVLVGGLWQPTEEIVLEPGMSVRAQNGEASILFRDHGVIRLDRGAELTLLDDSDRLARAPEVLPTLALTQGRIWVQGLLPAHLRGITVATSQGLVTVNEGSVSITSGETVGIEVYDRRTTVLHPGGDMLLVAGERIELWEGNVPLVKKIGKIDLENDPWNKQNISRDAAHRTDLAQLQQERRAAQAGILPTSRLYWAKRGLEKLDLAMTIGEEAKTEKQINFAGARLNEAAALLTDGEAAEVTAALEEYRDTLLTVASGSGDGTVAQFLLQQAVAQASVDFAAALPTDEGYIIKRAVLEASAELPDGVGVKKEIVQAEILVDTLSSLTTATEEGLPPDLQSVWTDLQPSIATLTEEGSALSEEVQKEVRVSLEQFALAMEERSGAVVDSALLEQIASYLPSTDENVVAVLTEEEVTAVAQAIMDRIYVYGMSQSRTNQLIAELKALKGHPEEGRILRALYRGLPQDSGLLEYVRKAITDLRWAQATK